MLLSIALLLFLVIGSVSAVDLTNVSDSEDSNLVDGEDSLSADNKLEISSEYSISETNIVNSHDDNLGDCSDGEEVLNSTDSYYENDQSTSDVEVVGDNDSILTSSSTDSVVAADASNNLVSTGSSNSDIVNDSAPKSTEITVSGNHYKNSAAYFTVSLTDSDGNALKNYTVYVKVNGKTYSGVTTKNGKVNVKTAALAVGTYTVKATFKGNSNYSSSTVTKKLKVLPSIIGSDLTKDYGETSAYSAQFWKVNKVLANTNVTFKVNGKTYTKTTNKNGVAKLNIKLAAGTYTITATNPYSKEKVSHKIVVKKDKTNFTFRDTKHVIKIKTSFTVILKSAYGQALKNQKVSFTYDNKKVTVKTDKDGKAKLSIPALSIGTHKISFKYGGSKNYKSMSGAGNLIVFKSTSKVSSSSLAMIYKDGSKFKVKLTDAKGNNIPNAMIKFKFEGNSTYCKTNKYGNARFTIPDNIKPGTYDIYYFYSQEGYKNYTYGKNSVFVLKADSTISAKDLSMKYKDGSTYNVVVKDKSGNVLKGVYVKTMIGSKSYLYKTDSNGVAKLKITSKAGYHTIKTTVADPCYKSYTKTNHVTVIGYKFVCENKYVAPGVSTSLSVKLVNEKSKAIKNKKITFTFKGKNVTAKTNSKGIAKVSLGVLSKGTYKVKFARGSVSDSANVYVINKIPIKNIISASKSVKKYISSYSKLPSTVKIGDFKVTTALYLYLAAKTIVKLKSGSKSGSVTFENLKNPSNPKKAYNLGYLFNYNAVAKSVVKTSDSKGKLPNSASSQVGTIGYNGLVSAFSRILVSYDKYDKMPKYITIKSLSGAATKVSGNLNSKNTISSLAAYLAASKNCEVNAANIQKLVSKLTKNCKNDKDKADAIFKYVRDAVGYSFYYNTKFGASGTLKAKTGNCVDLAHLLVAMYRNAGLPARYAHGTCTFSSGTYGHVWSQVLIGNTWTVADATSSRNSLGHIANWNIHSYSFKGYFSEIAF